MADHTLREGVISRNAAVARGGVADPYGAVLVMSPAGRRRRTRRPR